MDLFISLELFLQESFIIVRLLDLNNRKGYYQIHTIFQYLQVLSFSGYFDVFGLYFVFCRLEFSFCMANDFSKFPNSRNNSRYQNVPKLPTIFDYRCRSLKSQL